MGDETTKWKWGQFFGWGIGGAIGNGVAAGGINAVLASPTGPGAAPAWVVSGSIGALGGFVGGAAGYAVSYFLDAPRIRWEFKSALLFGIVFSMLIGAVLGFSSLTFIAARPDAHDMYTFVISAIAGFVSAGLSGVLNNLRITEGSD
jgi:hypothetical protein